MEGIRTAGNTERKGSMRDFTQLYKTELPHRAISVYIYLADRANKQDVCWPAIPTIARDLKLSESTVRRALRDLKREKLVEKETRCRDNGGCSSNLYRIHNGEKYKL